MPVFRQKWSIDFVPLTERGALEAISSAISIARGKSRSGGTTSAYAIVYETGFASWAGPLNGSLAFAIATVLLWLGVAWAMYSRRIFIKV